MELEQAAFLVVAEERENERKDKPTEREVDRLSEKTSGASATFDSHEEHHENCGTCNKAESTTSEESADTPSSKSDFNKLPCHSLVHDPTQHSGSALYHLPSNYDCWLDLPDLDHEL